MGQGTYSLSDRYGLSWGAVDQIVRQSQEQKTAGPCWGFRGNLTMEATYVGSLCRLVLSEFGVETAVKQRWMLPDREVETP